MDYEWAKIGAKVICVNDDPNFCSTGFKTIELTKNKIYTIRNVGIDLIWGSLCLWLIEIKRPYTELHNVIYEHNIPIGFETFKHEIGFHIDRFRPLITKTQEEDLEIFNKLLDKKNIEELV